MKFLVLAALIVSVAYGKPGQHFGDIQSQSPWQVGKLYKYDVTSYTLAHHEEGQSSGAAFKTDFIVRVKSPSHLQAKLVYPKHAQVHQQLSQSQQLPKDLQFKQVNDLEQPFEIIVENGIVQALNLPASMSLANENLVKGLVSALQVDINPIKHQHSQDQQVYEHKDTQFVSVEADVTGECETLYTVSPLASEWRRELPHLTIQQDPIEITKSNDYSKCYRRIGYHFGVPEAFKWSGVAFSPREYQFISRHTTQRIIASKDGTIYKSETTSTVNVKPIMYGNQKAEVLSKVLVTLQEIQQDNGSEWELSQNIRVRESLLYALTTKVIENKSNESSDSSDWAYKNDELPTENEPAYAALFMTTPSESESQNYPIVVLKLAQEVAKQIQSPNTMPKEDALSKFNILVRVIASMTTEQLKQASSAIEIVNLPYDVLKTETWKVYRDAVVQAGTIPAFQQIKTWILSNVLKGEEAAEVVGSLATTLRYPTKDLMTQFFRLSVSDEVRSQALLNTTALIAAAKFIQWGHVNNDSALEFYPTQMYGRLARKHDRFVLEEILPRWAQEMESAIENEDSHKAQVYIRVIGNLGHNAAIDVYAPYLEGKKPTTTYLRRQMVESLAVLANERDNATRSVLYKLLRNTAESYEVRVIAVQNIFRSIPTGAMMQAMALMTHDDPSIAVRAAIKSGIQTSSEMKEPRYMDLTRVAQAALPMLTKEKLETYYSLKQFVEFHDPKDELTLRSFLTHLGSEDSAIPKEIRHGWKSKAEGWNKEHYFTAATSSVRKLMDYFGNYNQKVQHGGADVNHKFSAENIAKILNIKQESDTPFEAALYFDVMFQQRFFAFDEQDLKQLPILIQQAIEKLSQGVDYHYIKIVNHAQVSIMFPVAMGVPFIYKYQTPALLHVQGKTKAQINIQNQESDLVHEMKFTYAKNIDGAVGFFDTLSNRFASAGVVNKVQFNIPVKLLAQRRSGLVKLQIQPITMDQDTTIMHYSVWPYTASQEKDSYTTVAQDSNTKIVERLTKVSSIDADLDQLVGVKFHFQGYSYSKDYKNLASVFLGGHDILSSLSNAAYQRDVALTNFNLRYIGNQQPIHISAVYDQKLYNNANEQQSQEQIKASEKSDTQSNSPARRSQMLDEVSSGIRYAKAQVLDLSVSFDEQNRKEYVISTAIASSPVDDKTQFSIFLSKRFPEVDSYQTNVVGRLRQSQISQISLLDALKEQPKAHFEMAIKTGQQEKIQIELNAERSTEYTNILRELPEAKQCFRQMAENNYYQPACQNMIAMATYLDQFKTVVHYKDVSPITRVLVNEAYRFANHLYFWDNKENTQKKTQEGKIEIETEVSYLKNSIIFEITSPSGLMRIQNVNLPKYAPAFATYAPISVIARLANLYTNQQYLPYCAVDGSSVNTFSNRSYDYELTKSWHVVMLDDARNAGLKGHSQEQIVVLARKNEQNQPEIYISYVSNDGKAFEIEMEPAQQNSGLKALGVKVHTNTKKAADGAYVMYKDDQDQLPFVQYYTSSNGDVNVVLGDERLRALYDGQRVIIFADSNRNNTRGICGRMSSEPRDDFWTPQGIVDQPDQFGASYAFDTETSDTKTQQKKEEAKKNAYQQKLYYTTLW